MYWCCKICDESESKTDENDVDIEKTEPSIQQGTSECPDEALIQRIPLNPMKGDLDKSIDQENTTPLVGGQMDQEKKEPDSSCPLQIYPYSGSKSYNEQFPFDAPRKDYVPVQPTAPQME